MPAIPVHHTATIDEPWDGPAAEAAMPDTASVLKYCHAWEDGTAPDDEKGSYSFPHHRKEGGPANLPGCRNGLARLDQAHIPDKDRTGVKAHLEAHLNDAKKKQQSSASPGGHNTVGRTAAVPTIEMLESDAQTALDAAQKRSAKAKAEIEAIVAAAAQENRSNLTPEEDARVGALLTEREAALSDVDAANSKIARIRLLAAQDEQDQKRAAVAVPTGAPTPKYDEVARVGREERTYHPGNDRKGAQFLRDTVKQYLGDRGASERLARHMAEEQVERGQQISRAVGTPGFTGLTVPQYLTDFYAPAVAAMRPFADACNHHDLPADGMTVNISRITTPAAVTLQASENAAVIETDMADTLLTENVQTAAGSQTISRQAIERGTGIEEVIMDDLFRRYATDIDSTLINQATTGLAAVANSITYTDSAPSGEALWPKLLQGAAASEAALLGFAQPNAVIMHSRRWYWLSAQLTSQWPMFGQPGIGGVAAGENLATVYGHGARGVLPNGMVAIADNNIVTNLGGGTNQDQMFVVATQECHLWEDPAAPVFLRCEQPAAANLGVLLVLYGYFCYSFRRYSNANSVIGGSGLIAPTF